MPNLCKDQHVNNGINIGVSNSINIGVNNGINIGVSNSINIGVNNGINIGISNSINISVNSSNASLSLCGHVRTLQF